MRSIIEFEELQSRLHDANVRVIDCRFELGNPQAGLEQYVNSHIEHALYFDLEKDLSGEVKEVGGRHPLPPIEEFLQKVRTAGISEDSFVVVYDNQDGVMASRCWWMLRYIGIENVFVLNGNFSSWQEKKLPTSTVIPTFPHSDYEVRIQEQMVAPTKLVEEVVSKKYDAILLDSRENKRFLGIEEPIDKMAGHIPGAMSSFWKKTKTTEGMWKLEEEMKQQFTMLPKEKEVIVYCGSGVTACPNVLALTELGYHAKLYVGSWSDWISYSQHPIAKGE
ncbi:sulfurtransferase [Alkalihalobacillus sp. LMS39]|uniref:sulfurtransferase n=1 Tax=Alkalihalobacillus sp. LMS39 TaxID=2924032 RepID=UPI001FB39BAF|nr:sulfurtransferase [Alkalihalobacillus sp. LMS39]UOE92294.1 sulfurtransferase [Alkalihalobacillus sp. LMS39]